MQMTLATYAEGRKGALAPGLHGGGPRLLRIEIANRPKTLAGVRYLRVGLLRKGRIET